MYGVVMILMGNLQFTILSRTLEPITPVLHKIEMNLFIYDIISHDN